MNKHKRGEALTIILIGLAIGCVVSYVTASKKAQELANATGHDVYVGDVIADEPVQSLTYPIVGAVAGWGVSKLMDGGADRSKSSSQDNNVSINADGNVSVNISGNSSSRSDTRLDNRNEDSFNNNQNK